MKGGKKERDYPPPCLSSGVFELSARLFRSPRNAEVGGRTDGRVAGVEAQRLPLVGRRTEALWRQRRRKRD